MKNIGCIVLAGWMGAALAPVVASAQSADSRETVPEAPPASSTNFALGCTTPSVQRKIQLSQNGGEEVSPQKLGFTRLVPDRPSKNVLAR